MIIMNMWGHCFILGEYPNDKTGQSISLAIILFRNMNKLLHHVLDSQSKDHNIVKHEIASFQQ